MMPVMPFPDLTGFLTTVQLLDCDGTVSHTLVLQLDGNVTIRFAAGHEVRIDPVRRTVLSPGVVLPASLLDAAAQLRREVG